jgi:hypothetical protein
MLTNGVFILDPNNSAQVNQIHLIGGAANPGIEDEWDKGTGTVSRTKSGF